MEDLPFIGEKIGKVSPPFRFKIPASDAKFQARSESMNLVNKLDVMGRFGRDATCGAAEANPPVVLPTSPWHLT